MRKMSDEHEKAPADTKRQKLATLSLATLGVVYGDIGTSPLYALRECFHGKHGIAPTTGNVLGVVSLIFWALIIIISIKYLLYVLRADDHGEGGVLALMVVAAKQDPKRTKHLTFTIAIGLFGAALLYGDGTITPAISVLSAIEGLSVATDAFDPYVIPITCAILIGLFALQRRGTGGIGKIFGPAMLVWFSVLALLGAAQIFQNPAVMAAASPLHAISFLASHGWGGVLVLGAVFLVVTGGEALYADMGHFGARPIRWTWFGFVLPALLINYFGQGALLLDSPEAVENPFYHSVPKVALYPMVALATTATIIASQAVISGAFSLTRQAVMLGYWPRIRIIHTSSEEIGQIYVPSINWMMMIGTLLLVFTFRSSSALAGAYGIAVTTTMIITTVLAYFVTRRKWGWHIVWSVLLSAAFLCVDIAFFGANIVKIGDGGWAPLLIASIVFFVMTAWRRGRADVSEMVEKHWLPLAQLFDKLGGGTVRRVPGTGVYLTGHTEGAPPALIHNIELNHALHERVILLTIAFADKPHVQDQQRVKIEELGHGFHRLVVTYGYKESPDVMQILKRDDTPSPPLEETTFILGHEFIIADKKGVLHHLRSALYAFLSRNSIAARFFFNLPPDRVLEIGSQVHM